jgi:hypothetical protein
VIGRHVPFSIQPKRFARFSSTDIPTTTTTFAEEYAALQEAIIEPVEADVPVAGPASDTRKGFMQAAKQREFSPSLVMNFISKYS